MDVPHYWTADQVQRLLAPSLAAGMVLGRCGRGRLRGWVWPPILLGPWPCGVPLPLIVVERMRDRLNGIFGFMTLVDSR